METWHFLYFLLPFSAFLYASVGHGGASSYLMLLSLFNFAPEQIRPAALLMNIVVSFLAFINFSQKNSFPKKLFLTLVIFSMPAAYLGGTITIDSILYKRILGVLLLFPVIRFLKVFPHSVVPVVKERVWIIALIGLSIGFFSGLIGIGGGIILGPILLMLGWANIRETATICALFIFLNSITGYWGASAWNVSIGVEIWSLIPLTILGGAAGAYFGAKRFNIQKIRYLLITVLLVASIKLISA
jgi:uncharacterized membrane protein YfcA